MATITGYTAERMKQIEDKAIIDGDVVGDNLILRQYNGVEINAGSVRGPQGVPGPTGPTSIVITTSTTRPTGADLFEGLWIYETDTDRVYSWNGTAWISRSEHIICTSTTRPAGAFAGLSIYETDTHRHLIYNGFRFDQPWNMPWGLMGVVSKTADQGSIGDVETDLTNLQLPSITFVANRRIKLTLTGRGAYGPSDYAMELRIKESTVSLSSASLRMASALQAQEAYNVVAMITPTPGAHTYKATAQRTAGSGTGTVTAESNRPAYLIAEDLGPNGPPA